MKSLACCFLLLLAGSNLRAATFSVTVTNDSGAGSLRQAIPDANASPGPDLITFGITNAGLTISVTNPLPVITDPVTMDATTQPDFAGAPVVELNGLNFGSGQDGLKINTSNSTIRGLVINRFTGDGIEITNEFNDVIEGNVIGLNLAATARSPNGNGIFITNSPGTIIGGIFSAQRNVISGNNQNGIRVDGTNLPGTMVVGNYIGLNPSGATALFNSANGVYLFNAPSNTIGGTDLGARNLISGNSQYGVRIEGTNSLANTVLGNFIGEDVTGTTNRGNSSGAIYLLNAPGNTIGGTNSAARNLLSGNDSAGIRIDGLSARANLVLGNYLGTAISGTLDRGNSSEGVTILNNAHDNVIGGTSAGAANVIAFNGSDGIAVSSGTNNALRANAIFSNAGLGIDLASDGVLANDAGDADTGANQLQNYPILSAASISAGLVLITGSLNSRPATTYELDFFANPLPDGFTNGEGQVYLGSTNVTTGADSNATFTVTFSVTLTGRYVSATATDPFGNTSEFSPCVRADSSIAPLTLAVVNTNDSGPGSLRQALLTVNSTPASSNPVVRFDIPGVGVRVISPAAGSPLPVIIEPVNIDGFTQPGSSANSLSNGNNAVWLIRLDGNSTGSGGVAPGERNLISRNQGDGVELNGLTATNTLIVGNFIGTDVTGTTGLGNLGAGILIASSARFNTVGAINSEAGNVIAFNGSDGVNVLTGTNNAIRGNNIFSNTALGIDLSTDGVTPNDPGDADGGGNIGNDRQNFPHITNAILNPSSTMIEGTLNSMPNGTYALDFFASFVRDSLTNGEGQVYLGTTMVATGGDSNATFSVTLPVGVTTGRWITATATDTNNNTSEFSAAFRASSTKPRVMLIVVNTNDSGPGSLRQAILANNSSFTLSNNLIQFQIPGGGVQTITPLTSFPGLTEAVTVDGYSQPGVRTNTLAAGDNAVLQIRIDGLSAGSGADGLRLEIDRCIVRGLSVTRSRSSAPIISLREIF